MPDEQSGPFPPIPELSFESGPLGVPLPLPVPPTPPTSSSPTEDTATDGGEMDPLAAAAESVEDYNEYLDRAIEVEDCSFCESVLRDLKGRPLDEQKQGVHELQRLKQFIRGGDEIPSEEEISELLEDFDIVEMPGVS